MINVKLNFAMLEAAVMAVDQNKLYSLLHIGRENKYCLVDDDCGGMRVDETLICQGTGTAVIAFYQKNTNYIKSFSDEK